MKLYLNFSLLVYNCWRELARPIWRSKWPNSPGSEGSERGGDGEGGEGERRGGGGGGVGLKTDQQPEDLNTTACLCYKPPSAPNFYAHSRETTKLLVCFCFLFFVVFTHHVSLLKRTHARARARTHERTSSEKMDCKKKLKSTRAPR